MIVGRGKVLRIVEAIAEAQEELEIKDEEVISLLRDIAVNYTFYKKIVFLRLPL
jgi:hypothetical protein